MSAEPASSGPDTAAADLVKARQVLLAPQPRQRRLSPAALRVALVDLHDFWLASRAGSLGIGNGTALIAVGGLGRREMAPYSDLDLVLVHDGKRDVTALADSLWYPLWDARIGLDHSVRTVGQAVEIATTDLKAAMGLLEARLVAGDRVLFDELEAAVRKAWRSGIHGRLAELVEAAEERWSRSGDVAHRVEPDLKNGHGGLRDIYLIDSLAAGQLVDRASAEVAEARELLLDTRTELHRMTGRARDVLRAQEADEIGTSLQIGDRFDLARALSGAARSVVYALDVAMRTAKASVPSRTARTLRYAGLGALHGSLSRGPARRPLDEGVVEQAGEVVLARDAQPTRDAALVLRVAATAARTGMPMAAGTLATLGDNSPELRGPWPRAALDELLSLLGAGPPVVDVVEALDRTGLWGRLFPEWGAVRDLPPRDRAHIWTVDRHLIEVVANAARLTTQVSRPDLLLLGALMHDLGKGRGGDHSVIGAALAEQIGTRLGLWPDDVRILSAVVRHHLLLPHTATRRDLDDPVTIERVVETLDGDGVLLEILVALAEADALATGPGVWREWKAQLIDDLAQRCRLLMDGRSLPAPNPLSDAQRARATSGGVHVDLEEAAEGSAMLTVVAPDRPGLLSVTAGVIALHSLQVHSADVYGADFLPDTGGAVTVFGVSPKFGSLPDPALLREEIIRALDGKLALEDKLEAKERDYGGTKHPGDPAANAKPKVLWFDDEATGAAVLELRATDRIGLLHSVAAVLESCDVDVVWARIETLGSSVVDSFCLRGTGPDGAVKRAERVRIDQLLVSAAG